MLVLEGDNVNVLYQRALLFIQGADRMESRNGPVLVASHPVMSVYHTPTRRVLFDERRDANPYFHLFECLWMLSGSQDGTWLDRFVRDFSSRFGEDGVGLLEKGQLWGAYGHRWRKNWDQDQLTVAVERLRYDDTDRRVVIAMWDPLADLWSREEWAADGGDMADYREPRDLPCNTHIYPRIVNGRLDLTVCCRSNDIIWGAYGANAVHFSFLLEYLAGRIGCHPGRLYQLSNNWHGYLDTLQKVGALERDDLTVVRNPYVDKQIGIRPIGENFADWDQDLNMFMEWMGSTNGWAIPAYSNNFFPNVATPALLSHICYRDGDFEGAIDGADDVAAPDWSLAMRQWLERRRAARAEK